MDQDHTDSTHLISQLTRPFQNINLNDSSDSSTRDSLSIVQSYHSNLSSFPGAPATLPGDAIDCATCRLSIIESERGGFLVCDGCELGFHIDCIGMRGRVVMVDEWLCCECSRKEVVRLRMRVKGEKRCRKNKLVDVTEDDLPRGDGEGEDSRFSRKHNPCDNTFGGSPFGVPVPSSRLLHRENSFSFQASDLVHRSVKFGPEELLQPKDSQIQSLAEFDVCPSLVRFKSSSNKRPLPRMRKKMCLESLSEFICRSCGGVLEEGWSVEFKNSKSKDELDILYCAPDGKKFESMLEVACYLGLTPNADTTECEKIFYEFDVSLSGSLDPKRRKTARLAPTNGDTRGKEEVMDDLNKDQFSGIKNAVLVDESVNCTKVMDANSEETSGSTSRESNDGYPVQYEDFFIMSAGKIDCRPSYYTANEIWPIGYKSCWHDKVTGSLFICEVLDGGDPGPVFKVKRSSCSRLPLPVGSTVLYKRNLGQLAGQHEENNFYATCADEDSVLMMLSDPSPQEHDLLFCLGSTISSNDQTSEGQFLQTSPCEGKPKNVSIDNTVLQDVIGEISVEERSSFLAWRKVCGKLIDACQNVFTRTGTFEYFCKHAAEATCSSKWDIKNQKLDENVDPLAIFCGLIRPADIPSLIRDRKAFEVSFELLSKWLDQNRFGLNVEFVQELLEPNLGAIAFHEYVRLKERETCSSSLTIGNGFLLAKTKDGVDLTSEKPIDDSTESCQTSSIPEVNYHVMDDNFIPPGKPVSSRLPPPLLSDALQVQEFLIRFHDVLELRDLFSFEELEKELISPWFDRLDHVKFQGLSEKCLDISSQRTLDTEFGPEVSDKDSHAVLHRKTVKTKEEPQDQVPSIALDRCNGFALTKIHCSLIRVLIGELQSKVAAIEKDAECWTSVMQTTSPEFGIGELKSKRGRKKDSDADCRISELRTKMNILPLNELTWPELVRRYILSICSLGGRLNSADITTCESRNIFRCLQGDGGVFCGSPTGVAGIGADAAFLAEAIQNIFGSFIREHDMIAVDDVKDQDNSERVDGEDFDPPDWAKVLEPVKKLPTNVGARIRKCVNESLAKNPPEWAKKVLEHSISKGVYKGNASGPTKRAVISVLADLQSAGLQQKPGKEQKKKRYISISDIIMQRCRKVLHRLAAHDDSKNLCNFLGRNFMKFSCGEDDGLRSSPAIVSRLLDFRTIDLKLAAGAYGGSHEAFVEDVREFWANLRIASKDKPDQIRLVEILSQTFDSLYQAEVLTQFQKLEKCKQSDCVSVDALNETDEMLGSPREIFKAPWERGLCKVCEIDRDDENVLLCDQCDAEYHRYCLDPPLPVIPKGNWFCPPCVAGTSVTRRAPDTWSNLLHCRKYQGEFTLAHLDFLAHLASEMEAREYWELGVFQRSHLLTFLCDELLSSALVRQHIDQCTDTSTKLMQDLRCTSAELKTLKYKEASFEAKFAESDRSFTVLGTDMQQGHDKYITRHCSSQSKSDFINNFSGDLFQSNRDQTNAAFNTPDLASFEDLRGLSSLATGNANISTNYPIMFLNNSQSESSELTSLRTQILQLNNSIASLYSQFLKVSMRREFLGSDSSGRSYWVLADLGTQPSLISIRNGEMQKNGQIISASFLKAVSPPFLCELGDNNGCPEWVSYNSDAEIKNLLHHLQDNNPRERELKESILQWESLVIRGNQLSESQHLESPQMTSSLGNCKNVTCSNSLCTMATSLLVDKYGPCVALESSELSNIRMGKAKGIVQQNMQRCECLEPIWPSRLHCFSCHRTFSTDVELDGHNDGKCSKALPASDKLECREISEGKSMISGLEQGGYKHEIRSVSASRSGVSRLSSSSITHQNDKSVCPFNYEDICSKFVINESKKDLVKDIGLLGSNGIPTFVPSISPHISDSVVMLHPQEAVDVEADKISNDVQHTCLQAKMIINANSSNSFPDNPLQCVVKHQERKVSLHCGAPMCKVWNCCIVPEPSLRPLTGRAGYILRQLKINLLDMDAALPEEAIRPSRSKLERRWAWRSFVKSAERIYEMAQATVALEDMIKSEYLRSTWLYWSSLTMAAKISTLSSLALRIYSLDAAIYYNKTSCSNSFQKRISSKKRKEQET